MSVAELESAELALEQPSGLWREAFRTVLRNTGARIGFLFVFSFIFRVRPAPGDPSGLDIFAFWLLCGLLPWTFLSNVINVGLQSLVNNHALVDRNKRLGWLSTAVFLELTRAIVANATSDDVYQLVMRVASTDVAVEETANELERWVRSRHGGADRRGRVGCPPIISRRREYPLADASLTPQVSPQAVSHTV